MSLINITLGYLYANPDIEHHSLNLRTYQPTLQEPQARHSWLNHAIRTTATEPAFFSVIDGNVFEIAEKN